MGQHNTCNEGLALLVHFGEPTYTHQLYYQTLYQPKPFRDAIIYYYDNGIYKIISPGEEHYGVYVLSGQFADPQYTIRYISFPSEDWGNKTAYHYLEFNNDPSTGKGQFIQRPIIDSGEAVGEQQGLFSLSKNEVRDPISVSWRDSDG